MKFQNKAPFAVVSSLVLLGVTGCDVRDFVPIPGVQIVQPTEGSIVTNPVYFELEAKHWDIEPPFAPREGAGYFVLALEGQCVPPGQLVPFDYRFVHLQEAEYVTWVNLAPGEHEVCLFIADGSHRATALTDTVRFEVVE